MAKEEQRHGVRGLTRMIICILIAALLWLIIKLSDTYTVTVPFAIHYVDIPASQLIQDSEQEVNATITTTGFKLLNYYFTPPKKRTIVISLIDVKYKRYSEGVYFYSNRYLIDEIGEFLATNVNDIILADDVQYFNMNPLASKKVKVLPVTNFTFEQQYYYYGEPTAIPDSVTIYGTSEDVQNIREVRTKVITIKNANQSVDMSVDLDLADNITSDINAVEVSVNVEKYTESQVIIPIEIPKGLNIHLYPSNASVRYIVAMKDYAIINKLSFKAIVDTTNMFFNDVLPVKLVLSPSNTQIIGIDPKAVEYVIIPQ